MSSRLAESPNSEGPVAELATETAAYLARTGTGERRRRVIAARLPASLQAGSPAWTWVGILVAVAGFVMLAVAWGQVAGETQVYLQLPYVVSAALVGLGVIMVGLTVVSIASRQQDAAARDHQIDRLLAAIEELQDALAAPTRKRR